MKKYYAESELIINPDALSSTFISNLNSWQIK